MLVSWFEGEREGERGEREREGNIPSFKRESNFFILLSFSFSSSSFSRFQEERETSVERGRRKREREGRRVLCLMSRSNSRSWKLHPMSVSVRRVSRRVSISFSSPSHELRLLFLPPLSILSFSLSFLSHQSITNILSCLLLSPLLFPLQGKRNEREVVGKKGRERGGRREYICKGEGKREDREKGESSSSSYGKKEGWDERASEMRVIAGFSSSSFLVLLLHPLERERNREVREKNK